MCGKRCFCQFPDLPRETCGKRCFVNFQTCTGKCTVLNRNCALCVGFNTGSYTPKECREKCNHVTVTDAINEDEVNGKYYFC